MIPLTKPWFDESELQAVKETLDSGWVAGQGPKNAELANLVCDITGSAHAIPVANCTSGLHLALIALGIGPGDEVIVPDFTFPATGHAVMYCEATPRFAEVHMDTFNLDVSKLERCINHKTKAIIAVHAFGQMADMDAIMEVAGKNNLYVIEDAACAFGAKYENTSSGKTGHISAFSFHARKNISSGEGGIVVTDNNAWAEKIKSLSCFGMESAFQRAEKFSIPTFVDLGYNYKLSDIQAAIAIQQISKNNHLVEKKHALVAMYNQLLSEVSQVTIPKVKEGNLHVYQTYAIVLDEKIDRDKMILALRNDGIQTQIGTYASHIQPVYKSTDSCPVSLFLYEQTLALPLYYDLAESQVSYIVERIEYQINQHGNMKI